MLSTADVADMKKVSRQAVSKAVKRGELHAEKVGRSYVVKQRDALDWEPNRDQAKRAQGRAEQLRRSAGKGEGEAPEP